MIIFSLQRFYEYQVNFNILIMNRLFSFHLPNKNLIILHTANQLFKYTFIEAEPNIYTTLFINQLRKVQTASIDIEPYQDMMRILQKNLFYQSIQQLQKKDITQEELRQIINKNNSNNLAEFAKYYWQFKSILIKNLCRKNIHQMLSIVGKMNYISLDLWEQILLIMKDNYQQQSIETRSNWMHALTMYFNKFYHERSQQIQDKQNQINEYQDLSAHLRPRYKFLIRQNCLKDIGDLRSIILNFSAKNETLLNSSNFEQQANKQRIQLLDTKFNLIHKVSKSIDLNLYSLKTFFQKDDIDQLLNFLQKNSGKIQLMEFLLSFYKFTSLIGINLDQNRFEKLIINIIKIRIKSTNSLQSFTQHQSSYYTNKILSIWKFKGQYNKELFNLFIEPTIKHILTKKQTNKYYQVFAYNLLCCFQKLVLINPKTWKEQNKEIISLLIEIMKKIKSQKIVSNRSIHIVEHFLNIYGLNIELKNQSKQKFQKQYDCGKFQNELLIQKIQQLHYRIYSPCLQAKRKPNSILYQSKIMGRSMKPKPATNMQYNNVQAYWQQIISLVVPSKNFINHCRFCSYQIDTLIITREKLIGIQIQGYHYIAIQQQIIGQNKQISLPRTGKRQLRENILQGYHIHWLKIQCWKKRQNYLMVMKNKQLSKIYIKQRLEEILGKSIQDSF